MGSFEAAYLGDGYTLCSFRDGLDWSFLNLFTKEDWIEFEGKDALPFSWPLGPEESVDEIKVACFRIGASLLRDRFDVMGYHPLALSSIFDDHFGSLADGWRYQLRFASSADVREDREAQIAELSALNWNAWRAEVGVALDRGSTERYPRGDRAGWLLGLLDGVEPRLKLRALLEFVPDSEEITVSVDTYDGIVSEGDDPREAAREFTDYSMQGGLTPIVLTEGSYDARVLADSFRVRKPHLAEFIRFPDFSARPEGGAAALRQTVRAFAAAGIPNRVVAVFDNDSAAQDVLRSLDQDLLPSNLKVMHLPILELAKNYPTIGPQGANRMDVNGLATSIELYLGVDVLTDETTHALRPVEWAGYVKGVSAYQGEVADKKLIQRAFEAKMAEALRNPQTCATEDWSDLDLVLDAILDALRVAI